MKRILTIFTLLMALATISKANTEDSIAMNDIGVGSQIVLKQPIRIEANYVSAKVVKRYKVKSETYQITCDFNADKAVEYSRTLAGPLTVASHRFVRTANNNTLFIDCVRTQIITENYSNYTVHASIQEVKTHLGDVFDIILTPPQEY